jgi:hypothetical protein
MPLPGKRVALWDMQGGGTVKNNAATYVMEKHLAAMDVLVSGQDSHRAGQHPRPVHSSHLQGRTAFWCYMGGRCHMGDMYV